MVIVLFDSLPTIFFFFLKGKGRVWNLMFGVVVVVLNLNLCYFS
jgi:hypothetical protein